MEERIRQQAEKYRKHFKRLFYTDCTVTDCSEPFACLRETKQPVFCEYCESIRGNGCCSMRTFQNGCAESYRWNTTCISLCSMGMVLMSSCLTEKNGNLCGGLTIGPLCMGNMEDILLDMPTGELRDMAMQMPLFTSAEVQSLSEILEAVTGYITGNMNSKASGYFLKQEEMLNALFTENIKKEAETDYYIYPVAQERKLRSAVQNQDREEAENILNQILAYMYQINHYSLELNRPRILELMIVLSRTAMDTGADMEMIVLPGGLPGSTNLQAHEGLTANIRAFASAGKKLAAICAAPMVFGSCGILDGKKATIYPGMEEYLTGAEPTGEAATVDGNIITGQGPALAMEFALAIAENVKGKETADAVAEDLLYDRK